MFGNFVQPLIVKKVGVNSLHGPEDLTPPLIRGAVGFIYPLVPHNLRVSNISSLGLCVLRRICTIPAYGQFFLTGRSIALRIKQVGPDSYGCCVVVEGMPFRGTKSLSPTRSRIRAPWPAGANGKCWVQGVNHCELGRNKMPRISATCVLRRELRGVLHNLTLQDYAP